MKVDLDGPLTIREFRAATAENAARFDGHDQNFIGIDQRFEKIDQRFEKIDQRFEKIDQRFEKIDQRFEGIDRRFEKIEARLDLFAETFVTKDVFFAEIKRLESIMYTKADHAKFMEWMDEAMTELRDMREERILTSRQMLYLDDKVIEHEQRLRVLESARRAV